MAEVETSLPPTMPITDEPSSPSPEPEQQQQQPKPTTSTDLTTTINTSTISAPAAEQDDSTSAPKKTKKIIRRKKRPARPQVDPATVTSEPPPQTGIIFNIWYNKWSGGDREDKYLSKTHAAGRCSIATDSGYTRADRVTGSYFCLFFAKGLCPKGQECEYLHRLPGLHDIFNPNVDCFGRDKHSDYRDDMGGVGSFMRQNRTLYIGRIHVTDDIEEIVARHFQEWGQIDRIRVLTARGVAFVTYTNEANSQFAKEAMAHQSLDHSEVLNVRWATVDPNPMAQKREARKIEEQAAEAVRRALPADFVAEIEGRDPHAAKRKRIEGGFGLQGYEAPDDVWYAKAQIEAGGGDIAQLENGDARLLLEDDMARRIEENQAEDGMDSSATLTQENGGILSGSTLSALKGYQAQKAGGFTSKTQAAASKGPLVAYDSDEDSD
ncbi:Pre-mRNA-splicing factor [Agyrium rufum]|nr:Pre-mRNA-splicing factor [Agyrium rufum]